MATVYVIDRQGTEHALEPVTEIGGVRFVNVFHEAWDHHSDVEGGLRTQCGLTDKPCAARRFSGECGPQCT